MQNQIKRTLVTLASLILSSSILTTVNAATDFPKKPVTMTVAYSAGGGTDTAARLIAKYVEPYLGQRLIIQNKPGAGGQIGFTSLAKAKNDGYKIGFINLPSLQMVKMLRKNVPYEISDFEAIANIQLDPVVIAVKADSKYQTLQQLLDDAKKFPGKINIGGDGPQSNNQLQLVVAEDKLDVKFNFVPFNGSGPAVTATLGSQVIASIPSASSAANHVRNGKLRVLAVFSNTRFPYLPSVPTIKEATGITVPPVGASIRGIAVPKGMSAENKLILENAFAKVMQDEKFIAHADKIGMPLMYMNAKDFDAYLKTSSKSVKQYIDLIK